MFKTIMTLSLALGVLLLSAAQTAGNPIPIPPIGLNSDAAGTNPIITEPAGTVPIYVFLNEGSGVQASLCLFSAPKPSCFNAEYVGETHDFPTTGNSQTGMEVYLNGGCFPGPMRLAVIYYEALGPTPECCIYWVRPYPGTVSGLIEIFDCVVGIFYGRPGYLIINPNFTLCAEVVPAETSTWGKVKSLYAQ